MSNEPLDVRSRIREFAASGMGVTQQEIRELRNEIASSGITTEKLDDVKAARFEFDDSFTATGHLEARRVEGLGVQWDRFGTSHFSYTPFQGIDWAAANPSRWGVEDQFALGFPTYQREVPIDFVFPERFLKRAQGLAKSVIERWHHDAGSDPSLEEFHPQEPSFATAIYDLRHHLVGYQVTFTYAPSNRTWPLDVQAFWRFDDKDQLELVSARILSEGSTV